MVNSNSSGGLTSSTSWCTASIAQLEGATCSAIARVVFFPPFFFPFFPLFFLELAAIGGAGGLFPDSKVQFR
jgi:hypothetical protein